MKRVTIALVFVLITGILLGWGVERSGSENSEIKNDSKVSSEHSYSQKDLAKKVFDERANEKEIEKEEKEKINDPEKKEEKISKKKQPPKETEEPSKKKESQKKGEPKKKSGSEKKVDAVKEPEKKKEEPKKEDPKKEEPKKEEPEKKEEPKKEKPKKEEPKKAEPKKKQPEKFTSHSHKGEYSPNVDLNMRGGPGVDYEVVNYIASGTKVVASEAAKASDGGTWYKVKSGDKTGWVNSYYLSNYQKPAANSTNNSGSSNKSSTSDQKAPAKKYAPNTIYFNGKAVPFKNGGRSDAQRIIDTTKYASTWGGNPVFSGNDGQHTNFVGHSPGNFMGIQNAKSFIITDANGTPFTYTVDRVYKVNGKAIGTDGTNYWDRLTTSGGGERVSFQTCIVGNDGMNWIIEASP